MWEFVSMCWGNGSVFLLFLYLPWFLLFRFGGFGGSLGPVGVVFSFKFKRKRIAKQTQ